DPQDECGCGDDADGSGNAHPPVAVAVHVAHDRGERGVVDPSESRPLDERTERVGAVDDPCAHNRQECGELREEGHDGASGRPPESNGASLWCNTCTRFISLPSSLGLAMLTLATLSYRRIGVNDTFMRAIT